MPTYHVYMSSVVSTCLIVEADDDEHAEKVALDQGIPNLMFLDHIYPDQGQWDVDEVEQA